MFSEFLTYARLGLSHIADVKGFDHIAFLAALTASYSWREWRALVWLVTAFTVGHSCTLALATFDVVRAPAAIVEPLIAVTIVVAGMLGAAKQPTRSGPNVRRESRILYALTVVFGLVHGLGFSTYLRALLGGETGVLFPLMSFNLGLEVGQLIIVSVVGTLGPVVVSSGRVSHDAWRAAVSWAAVVVGGWLFFQRLRGV